MSRRHSLVVCLLFARAAAGQSIHIDSARREVVVSVGPLRLPAATPYDEHSAAPPLTFTWPVSGWARGARVELVDSAGRVLPKEMLHHAGIANLDRRQLLYPMAERLFAAGRETGVAMLPRSLGVPVVKGHRFLMYYAVANPTNRDIEGATLRLTVAWVPENERGPREVLPLEIDASPIVGESSTFDIPPGLSTRSMEFTLPISGTVLHLGGHLHDHGVELRLEDVETGKILVRLGTTRDAEGHLVRVDRSGFLMRVRGLHLSADHPYRIVGVYDNHTCATISGAMAGIGAVFAPDKAAAIPSVDTTDALYMKDVRWLLAQGSSEPHAGHSTHHDRSTGGTCADQSKR